MFWFYIEQSIGHINKNNTSLGAVIFKMSLLSHCVACVHFGCCRRHYFEHTKKNVPIPKINFGAIGIVEILSFHLVENIRIEEHQIELLNPRKIPNSSVRLHRNSPISQFKCMVRKSI